MLVANPPTTEPRSISVQRGVSQPRSGAAVWNVPSQSSGPPALAGGLPSEPKIALTGKVDEEPQRRANQALARWSDRLHRFFEFASTAGASKFLRS